MDDQPAQAGAALPRGEDGAREAGLHRCRQISARGDDRGVAAAQLQQGAAHPCRDPAADVPAGFRTAGEADERDAGVIGQAPGEGAVTVRDEGKETVRGTCCGGRPGRELLDRQRAAECPGGGLPDDAVAADVAVTAFQAQSSSG